MRAVSLSPLEHTITGSDLTRMRLTATGQVDKILEQQKQLALEQKQKLTNKANQRKEYMQKMQETAKLNKPPSQLEQTKKIEKQAVITAAERKLFAELDDVKKMDHLTRYAKVMAIRDAQIQEKKVIEKEKLEEERRLDTMMEVERLKSLQMYAEREERRAADQKLGAQVIVDQIEARERERLRQRELQDQEREALVLQNEELKKKEMLSKLEQAKINEKILNEVAVSNAQQIQIKEREKKREKLADAREHDINR